MHTITHLKQKLQERKYILHQKQKQAYQNKLEQKKLLPANIYLFKINNTNTRKMC